MTDDTIPEDVLDEVENKVEIEDNAEVENHPVDSRQDAIEAMAESRAEEIASEVEEFEPTNVPAADDEPQLITVKVDGEEQELSLDDVVKGYQKDAAGSQKLKQAAEERQQLDDDKKAFQLEQDQYNQQLAKQDNEPEHNQQPSTDVDNDFVLNLQNAMDDLAIGSDDEKIQAAMALKELLGRGDNPTIPEDEIISQAAQQATNQALSQLEFNSARDRFTEDYQDIVADATLLQMATNEYQRAASGSQTHEEAFVKAGNAVRQWRDGLVSNNQPVSDKIAKKQLMAKEPSSAGKRAVQKPARREPTPSEIISAMKAGRGQPT